MSYFHEADHDFLADKASQVPGWLLDYAARITIAMIRYQDEIGVDGSFLEIGVYAGKYLSVLYRAAKQAGADIVALDPYEHFTTAQVTSYIGASSEDDLVFLKGFSCDFKAPELIANLRKPARFVSIDASHDAVDVLHDLRLVEQALHTKGIVAVDDFLNTECLGVVEAVGRFLDGRAHLVPFLFTSNKLFMAPLRAAKLYSEFLDRFCADDTGNAQSARIAEARSRQAGWGTTDFYGHPVLVI